MSGELPGESMVRHWRLRWLRCINQLTDGDLQERSWLDPENQHPMWSFVEFMCEYFDDLLVGIPYERHVADGWVRPGEARVLAQWHESLSAYRPPAENGWDCLAILNDPNWKAILDLGLRARQPLAALLEEEERNALLLPINYQPFKWP